MGSIEVLHQGLEFSIFQSLQRMSVSVSSTPMWVCVNATRMFPWLVADPFSNFDWCLKQWASRGRRRVKMAMVQNPVPPVNIPIPTEID